MFIYGTEITVTHSFLSGVGWGGYLHFLHLPSNSGREKKKEKKKEKRVWGARGEGTWVPLINCWFISGPVKPPARAFFVVVETIDTATKTFHRPKRQVIRDQQ